ncbi:MAG TPA: hypothetical protein VI564_00465 [Candidatus Nanoarchaeia archaeon]|nr:hypothetical protein [Candidatus Nanoarchaeia archaeon]
MGLFSGLLGLFKKNPLAKEIELLQYAKYYVDSARSFVIQFGRIEEKNIPKFAVKIRNDIIKAEKCYLQANQKESGKQCKLLIELFSFLDKNPHFDSRTIARYNELCRQSGVHYGISSMAEIGSGVESIANQLETLARTTQNSIYKLEKEIERSKYAPLPERYQYGY